MSGCVALTDVGLAALLDAAPRLAKLNVTRCPRLTDATLDRVAKNLGPSLEELFQQCGRRLSLRTTLQLVDQLLDCVGALHEHHLAHGDIKPANFCMDARGNGKVYVIDFGLSKWYEHPQTRQHIAYREGCAFSGNPRYARLISAFRDITGVPIVLNTSFNENEPVVCKPEEAIDCFLRTKMDVLVLGDTLIQR